MKVSVSKYLPWSCHRTSSILVISPTPSTSSLWPAISSIIFSIPTHITTVIYKKENITHKNTVTSNFLCCCNKQLPTLGWPWILELKTILLSNSHIGILIYATIPNIYCHFSLNVSKNNFKCHFKAHSYVPQRRIQIHQNASHHITFWKCAWELHLRQITFYYKRWQQVEWFKLN